MNVGDHVRLKKSLVGVPRDTIGVVDFVSPKLTWVAWDLPSKPLPPGYCKWVAKAYEVFRFERTAFEADEVIELLALDQTAPNEKNAA